MQDLSDMLRFRDKNAILLPSFENNNEDVNERYILTVLSLFGPNDKDSEADLTGKTLLRKLSGAFRDISHFKIG